MYERLTAQNNETIAKIDALTSSIANVHARMGIIEQKIRLNEEIANDIQSEVETMKTGVTNGFLQINHSIKEDQDILRRINNLIIMGAPESPEGLSLVKDLFQIILPDKQVLVRDHRLGPANDKPRPLRIYLDNAGDKRTALNNCKKLKGIDHLKNLSVKQDLTKAQQIQRRNERIRKQKEVRESPVITRSTSQRRASIENDQMETDEPSAKRIRSEHTGTK